MQLVCNTVTVTLTLIIIFTLVGSIASLAGSFFLLFQKKLTENFSNQLISLAAGVLIAVAFLDLLPEASELTEPEYIFLPALLGFIIFFMSERFIRVFHHHHGHGEKPSTYLILIGDAVHNFVDGVAITIGFLTSTTVGITTSFAVAAHEIPQEIADMGILLANGLSKKKALFLNFLSALTALLGALLAYFFAAFIEQNLYIFLSLTAGFFIYISASDLIPNLHEKLTENRTINTIIFLLGVVAVYSFKAFFEGSH